MAIRKRTLRGVQDIRTRSGTIDRGNTPTYKVYMNLSCLEMEKFRRGKEKEDALRRIENINSRFRDIETEKGKLLRSMTHPERGRPRPVQDAEPGPVAAPAGQGFKIRY